MVEENTEAYSNAAEQISKPATAMPTLGTLSKLRQEVAGRQQSVNQDGIKPLTEKELTDAWEQYTQLLRLNKNSALPSFERAARQIINDSLFEIIANNNLEQKFIEQEKRNLSTYLQKIFNNKAITFSVIVNENNIQQQPTERTLNKREQFQIIAEQYPLVKELKDRLRLELDY